MIPRIKSVKPLKNICYMLFLMMGGIAYMTLEKI